MSSSDDEDDFLSADEDEFACDQDKRVAASKQEDVLKQEPGKKDHHHQQQQEKESSCKIQKPSKVIEASGKEKNEQIAEQKQKVTASEGESKIKSDAKELASADRVEDDEDEEALAERIRERNLKIARKFSAEIAKNVKASAPIPVKLAPPSVEYNANDKDLQTTFGEANSASPQAPPSTPALSSSFNANEQSIPQSPNVSAATTSSTTQYAWRIPAKVSEPKITSETNAPSSSTANNDQARLALDRLSERLSKPEKNLFEMVADDIKKVTLKTTQSDESQSTASIPLISDIGSMFGGWNWNSASQLLASSASQVTSQVGSVIDSVVHIANQPPSQQQVEKDRLKHE